MGILELIIVLITIAGLFIWNRAEANSDRRDMMNMINAHHMETYAETKDFHGRLCAIEERNKEKP